MLQGRDLPQLTGSVTLKRKYFWDISQLKRITGKSFHDGKNQCITVSFRYEISNCLFEATLQEIEHVCGCTLQNFVDVVDGFEACDGQKKECMDELMQGQYKMLSSFAFL